MHEMADRVHIYTMRCETKEEKKNFFGGYEDAPKVKPPEKRRRRISNNQNNWENYMDICSRFPSRDELNRKLRTYVAAFELRFFRERCAPLTS